MRVQTLGEHCPIRLIRAEYTYIYSYFLYSLFVEENIYRFFSSITYNHNERFGQMIFWTMPTTYSSNLNNRSSHKIETGSFSAVEKAEMG